MSFAKGELKRSTLEKIFILFFLPAVLMGYLLYKYPSKMAAWGIIPDERWVYFFNKSPSFWYSTLYTFIVCLIAGTVLWKNSSPYKKGKNQKLSPYQRNKFLSIFLVQLVLLYLIPYFIGPMMSGQNFFYDQTAPTKLDAYVYVSKGFSSWGGIFYVFILVPLSVWFFGKRYCSWFCACGNLAETIGVTKWGSQWVKYKTPTGPTAKKMESLQTLFLIVGVFYGLILFFDFLKFFSFPELQHALQTYQEIVVDLIFGALIGVGAYPFLGTRIWCRYGCPLAKMMELQGRYFGSRFQVAANDKCKGLNLCSQVCPMGIDVASYAHKDKKPIMESFGLKESPCIGCGGCIDICPVEALSFKA